MASVPGAEPATDDSSARPQRPERRSLGGDVLLTFASKALVLVITVGMTVVVARALGPAGRGLVSVALAFSLILIQIGTVGLVNANPYFAVRDRDNLTGLYVNSLWTAGVLGGLLFVAGVLLKWLAPGAIPGLGWTAVLITLAMIPAGLGSAFLQSLLLAQGRTVAYNLVEVVHNVLLLGAIVVVLLVLGLGIDAVLIVITLAWGFTLLAYVALLRGHVGPRRRPELRLAREVVRYGLRVYVVTLLSFLVIRLDMFFVNAYLGASKAGLYSIAAALAEGVYLLPIVVGINLFPRVAEGGESESSAAVFRIMFVLYGAFCLVSVPLVRPFIEIFYGSRFAGAAELYYWLVPGVFALGMLAILSQHFAGRGYPRSAVLVWFVGLGVNVAINLVFLKGHGAYIASLSSSVAYSLLLALHVWLFARELGGYRRIVPRLGEAAGFVRLQLGRLAPALSARRQG
jgi:O-antigen/teichoic acid export membrane protein